MKKIVHINFWFKTLALSVVGLFASVIFMAAPSYALSPVGATAPAASPAGSTTSTPANESIYQCGSGTNKVYVSINIGCKGNACDGNNPSNTQADFSSSFCQGNRNAIIDMTFAIIRFLSDGVGLVIIASLIWAGIQFTSSRGDPQATANSMKRIQSNVFALFLFFFAYAMLNYVIPGAVL